jgi:hypothetical protein
MKCERCENVAVEHVTFRAGGTVRELHLCEACAHADVGTRETRRHARQNWPLPGAVYVHDFIRHWERRRRSLGRELSKGELIQIIDHLHDEPGASERRMQRAGTAGILSRVRKWFRGGSGR